MLTKKHIDNRSITNVNISDGQLQLLCFFAYLSIATVCTLFRRSGDEAATRMPPIHPLPARNPQRALHESLSRRVENPKQFTNGEVWLRDFLKELERLIPPEKGNHHKLQYSRDGRDFLQIKIRAKGWKIDANLTRLDMNQTPEEAASHAARNAQRIRSYLFLCRF